MSTIPSLTNVVRERRMARGWSQQELADRASIARASVSAIEMGRLVPSATAALALAAALGCRVEDLFRLQSGANAGPEWAWQPPTLPARYWQAQVGGRSLLIPLEPTYAGTLAHDGVFDGETLSPRVDAPPPTLVMACCDPAVALLCGELARASGLRLLPLVRSSGAALGLLKQGVVHAAGLHLGAVGSTANAEAVRAQVGAGYRLVRVANWQEGIVTQGDRKLATLGAASKARLRWVGREPGSGAQRCLDEVLGTQRPPRRIARDHRSVAEAVRGGWADAGICLRLVGEEAALRFLPVREEAYDLCFSAEHQQDPEIRALLKAVRSARYRSQLDDLPGYRAATGELIVPGGN